MRSALAAGGAQRPQETPGTYYWQVWGSARVSRRLRDRPGPAAVLPANGALAVKPPKTVYAGFPFILGSQATGVPTSRRSPYGAAAGRR